MPNYETEKYFNNYTGYKTGSWFVTTTSATLTITSNWLASATSGTNAYANLLYQKVYYKGNVYNDVATTETEEEKAARLKRQAEQALLWKKREAERLAAIEKARELLLMHLNIPQTRQFEKDGSFLVVSEFGNLYQIRTGRSHNIRQLDPVTMIPIRTLCAHPIEAVPNFDTMLAQKLMLELNEHDFVLMANISTPVGQTEYAGLELAA